MPGTPRTSSNPAGRRPGSPRGTPNAPPAQRFSSRDNQVSVYGKALPIIFGTQRVVGINVMSGAYWTGYTYSAVAVNQLALCEGTIGDVLLVWKNQATGTPAAIFGGTRELDTGTLPQDPWSWLAGATGIPELALSYGGVAMMNVRSGVATLANGELDRLSFEVVGLRALYQDGSSTAYDAHPGTIIRDLLTNMVYGLRWDESLLSGIDGVNVFAVGADGTEDSSFWRYCIASGFLVSLALTEQQAAADTIQELLDATDSVAFWSEGTLKIQPLGTESVTGGGVTYTPELTPVYDLGYSQVGADFLAESGEPAITLERAKRADTYNCFPVEFSNRFPARVDTTGAALSEPLNAYNNFLEDGVPDPVDVEKVGLRKADATSLPCITRPAHARAISILLARRALYVSRSVVRFRLSWRFVLLEPTDLVTITDASLGLSRQLARILELEETDAGDFDVVAELVETIATAEAATYTLT